MMMGSRLLPKTQTQLAEWAEVAEGLPGPFAAKLKEALESQDGITTETLASSEFKQLGTYLGTMTKTDSLSDLKSEDQWFFKLYAPKVIDTLRYHYDTLWMEHRLMDPHPEGVPPNMLTYSKGEVHGMLARFSIGTKSTEDYLSTAEGLKNFFMRLAEFKNSEFLTAKEICMRDIINAPVLFMKLLYSFQHPKYQSYREILSAQLEFSGIFADPRGIFKMNSFISDYEKLHGFKSDIIVLANGTPNYLTYNQNYLTTSSESGGNVGKKLGAGDGVTFFNSTIDGRTVYEDSMVPLGQKGQYQDLFNRIAVYGSYSISSYKDGFAGEDQYFPPVLEVRDLNLAGEWKALNFKDLVNASSRWEKESGYHVPYPDDMHKYKDDPYTYDDVHTLIHQASLVGDIPTEKRSLTYDIIHGMHFAKLVRDITGNADIEKDLRQLRNTIMEIDRLTLSHENKLHVQAFVYAAGKRDSIPYVDAAGRMKVGADFVLYSAQPSVGLGAEGAMATVLGVDCPVPFGLTTIAGIYKLSTNTNPIPASWIPYITAIKKGVAALQQLYIIATDVYTHSVFHTSTKYCPSNYRSDTDTDQNKLFAFMRLFWPKYDIAQVWINPTLTNAAPLAVVNWRDLDNKYPTLFGGVTPIITTAKTMTVLKDDIYTLLQNKPEILKIWNAFFKKTNQDQEFDAFVESLLQSITHGDVIRQNYEHVIGLEYILTTMKATATISLTTEITKISVTAYIDKQHPQRFDNYVNMLPTLLPQFEALKLVHLPISFYADDSVLKPSHATYQGVTTISNIDSNTAKAFNAPKRRHDTTVAPKELADDMYDGLDDLYEADNYNTKQHMMSRYKSVKYSVTSNEVARIGTLEFIFSELNSHAALKMSSKGLPPFIGTHICINAGIKLNMQGALWAQSNAGMFLTRTNELGLGIDDNQINKEITAHYSVWQTCTQSRPDRFIFMPDVKFNGYVDGMTTSIIENQNDWQDFKNDSPTKKNMLVFDIGFISRDEFSNKYNPCSLFGSLKNISYLESTLRDDKIEDIKFPAFDFYNDTFNFAGDEQNHYAPDDYINMTMNDNPALLFMARHQSYQENNHGVLINKTHHVGNDICRDFYKVKSVLKGQVDFDL